MTKETKKKLGAVKSEIEVGSVVQLKSGGPSMTVADISNLASVRCSWFDGGHTVQGAYFPINALKLK